MTEARNLKFNTYTDHGTSITTPSLLGWDFAFKRLSCECNLPAQQTRRGDGRGPHHFASLKRFRIRRRVSPLIIGQNANIEVELYKSGTLCAKPSNVNRQPNMKLPTENRARDILLQSVSSAKKRTNFHFLRADSLTAPPCIDGDKLRHNAVHLRQISRLSGEHVAPAGRKDTKSHSLSNLSTNLNNVTVFCPPTIQ